MSSKGYLEGILMVLHPTSELGTMVRFDNISFNEKISFAVQTSQK